LDEKKDIKKVLKRQLYSKTYRLVGKVCFENDVSDKQNLPHEAKWKMKKEIE